MLQISGLNLTTDFSLALDINLIFEPATVTGLIGPNGSGKSTLMRTIVGLRNEKTGLATIKFENKVLSPKEVKEQLFYFESTNWFNNSLSGMDYLKLISDVWKTDKQLIDEMVDFWHLSSFIHKPIKKYSLGMKQKLLLSLYHVSNANYLFLDEPTLALDRESVERFKEYLLEQKTLGKCIFFSAHESEEFFKICDKIYAIHEQKIIQLSLEGRL